MKKLLLYFVGVVVIAFGISLCYQCQYGSGSIDALIKNISDVINLEFFSIGRVLMIMNLLFVLAYYLVFRRKDVVLPIIVTFILGFLIDLFNSFNIINDTMFNNFIIRTLFFVLAINIISLGVAMMVVTRLSPSAYECLNLIVKKYLNKLSYGVCKIIVEAIVTVIASVIGLVFLKSFGEVSVATLLIMLTQGPLIDLYIKNLKKLNFLN